MRLCHRPPHPPRPFTPAGAKGGFNSRFCGFAPATGKLQSRCGAPLRSAVGQSGGRSKWPAAARACQPHAAASLTGSEVSASERAPAAIRALPPPLERAEQRRVGRIRAGACLSEASLRTTPHNASSARNPAGARSTARLSFAYFSLAKQRKVRRPPGRNPACHAVQTTSKNNQISTSNQSPAARCSR